jgi:anaerobic magnesium-protoporphyrin IX monomethyl ester cyclase
MRILLVVYDNDSYISYFPHGISYIASVCRKSGHEVNIYSQDVYHWPESHLVDLLNREQYDVVGIGIVGGYYQYKKLLQLSDAINSVKNRPLYILGGHGPSPEPEYFLKKTGADFTVIGEGEETILDLLDAIEKKKDPYLVKGIAFMKDGKCVQTPRRELIGNVNDIPLPAWDLFPMNQYILMRQPHMNNSDRYMSIISGRGCTFKCNFCYRMDPGFRPRSVESIVEEIRQLQKDYSITYIEFTDDLLMSSVERTMMLCEGFMKAKLNIKWYCEGRLNYAKPDVLEFMKRAGCVFINYGIESLDQQALRTMNKALTIRQIKEGVENTIAAGISPGLNIIFGNIGETIESLKMGVEFLLKYDNHAQLRTIRPVTPYPGSPLYYYAIEKGLLKDVEDFYENKHLNSDLLAVNFTDLKDDEFYKALMNANLTLLQRYYEKRFDSAKEQTKDLYMNKNIYFRGYRQT